MCRRGEVQKTLKAQRLNEIGQGRGWENRGPRTETLKGWCPGTEYEPERQGREGDLGGGEDLLAEPRSIGLGGRGSSGQGDGLPGSASSVLDGTRQHHASPHTSSPPPSGWPFQHEGSRPLSSFF